VDSEVIEIQFHRPAVHIAEDEAFLFKVIKAAFGQRRKPLKNALAGSELHMSPNEAREALNAAGIAPERRAETLAVEEFIGLAIGVKAQRHHKGTKAQRG
jgi:16S rRNA (adenine1518-N6/adenine1519-N6)-dimethyltransferase